MIVRAAEKEVEKLPKGDYERTIKRIFALADDPRPSGCKKLANRDNEWRIRSGAYRVLYTIDDGAKLVEVFVVKHRSGAY